MLDVALCRICFSDVPRAIDCEFLYTSISGIANDVSGRFAPRIGLSYAVANAFVAALRMSRCR